jgi:GT2 family glycosyltransferase
MFGAEIMPIEKTERRDAKLATLPRSPSSVSVIIPTKNRAADLNETVESLLQQTVQPLELIIIDQSATPEIQRQIEKRHAESPVRFSKAQSLQYVWDTTLRGVNQARNRAMELAKGEILLFLDDDVCLEPNFVEELMAVYGRYPQVGGVAGIITNYQPPSWGYRAWSWVFCRGPFLDDRQPIYWNADRLRQSEPLAVSRFGSNSMSFRAKTLNGLRFEEGMSGVTEGDDVDFCARLQPGTRLVIAPRARLVHKKSPAARAQEHWLVRYTQGYQYLYQRHWNSGFRNPACFVWLNFGCVLAAIAGSVWRGSLKPWRALAEGAERARRAVEGS